MVTSWDVEEWQRVGRRVGRVGDEFRSHSVMSRLSGPRSNSDKYVWQGKGSGPTDPDKDHDMKCAALCTCSNGRAVPPGAQGCPREACAQCNAGFKLDVETKTCVPDCNCPNGQPKEGCVLRSVPMCDRCVPGFHLEEASGGAKNLDVGDSVSCVLNQCKCPHGVARDGTTGCWKDGGVNCVSCGQGFHLVKLREGELAEPAVGKSAFLQTFLGPRRSRGGGRRRSRFRELGAGPARDLFELDEEVHQPTMVDEIFSTIEESFLGGAMAPSEQKAAKDNGAAAPRTLIDEGARYQCVPNRCTCPEGGRAATGTRCPKHGLVFCTKCFLTHLMYPDRRCRKIQCQCQNGRPSGSGCIVSSRYDCDTSAPGFYLTPLVNPAAESKGPSLQKNVRYLPAFASKLRNFEGAEKPGSNRWRDNVAAPGDCAAACRMTLLPGPGCKSFSHNSAEKTGPNCELFKKMTNNMKADKKMAAGWASSEKEYGLVPTGLLRAHMKRCRCQNGESTTGANCPRDDAIKCARCDVGYKLIMDDKIKAHICTRHRVVR